jgi:hypothetical protein
VLALGVEPLHDRALPLAFDQLAKPSHRSRPKHHHA